MPDDLRGAHNANDDTLESALIGRGFEDDAERLEWLLASYDTPSSSVRAASNVVG
jgi:hypothetical protein